MDYAGKTHYELLGLERSATTEEIREAYREIARVFHPDSNFYDEIVEYELSEEQNGLFKTITAAYQTLIHKDKRQAYDRTLPPELRGWDDHRNEDATITGKFHDAQARSAGSSEPRSASYGTFGQMVEDDDASTNVKSARFGSGMRGGSGGGMQSVEEVDAFVKHGGFRGGKKTSNSEPTAQAAHTTKKSTDGQHGLGVHHRSASVLPTVEDDPRSPGAIPSWVWTLMLVAVPFLGGVGLVMFLGHK